MPVAVARVSPLRSRAGVNLQGADKRPLFGGHSTEASTRSPPVLSIQRDTVCFGTPNKIGFVLQKFSGFELQWQFSWVAGGRAASPPRPSGPPKARRRASLLQRLSIRQNGVTSRHCELYRAGGKAPLGGRAKFSPRQTTNASLKTGGKNLHREGG